MGVINPGGSGSTIVTPAGGVGAMAVAELKRKLWLPTAMLDGAAAAGDAIDESSPRLTGAQTVTLANGTAYAVGNLIVPAGRTVDSITFTTAGSGASGITGYFFALVRQSDLTVLARSADSTAAWAANTPRTLLMAAPWTAAVDTPVYAVVCMVASGMPSLTAYASHIQSVNRTPVMAGSSNTGLTNAASLPSPITAPVQAAAGVPYASINSLTAAPAADVSEGLFMAKDLASLAATDATGKVIFTAPCPLIVRSFEFVSTAAVSVDPTNFWSFELGRLRNPGNTYDVIATKTTNTTGGAAVFAMTPFSFETVTFDANASVLLKDDSLVLRPTKNGTAGTINAPAVTVRYSLL